MKTGRLVAALAVAAVAAGCSDIRTTSERSALLNSPGPLVTDTDVDGYLTGLKTIRRFYVNTATFGAGAGTSTDVLTLPKMEANQTGDPTTAGGIPANFTKGQLKSARTLILAYVDSQCDRYIDAVFWANRTRQGVARGNNAIGSAVSTILGATGTPTHVMGIVASAFGLSGSLFDTYYASVLYGLEPSSVRHLVDQSQLVFRANIRNVDPSSEAILLQQVQEYIRQCTPAHIEYLVESALKKTEIVAQTPNDTATILFIDGWQVKADGTSVDPSGQVFALQKKPKGAPFTLLENGRIEYKGKTHDYKALGLAQWGEVPETPSAATDDAGQPEEAGTPRAAELEPTIRTAPK